MSGPLVFKVGIFTAFHMHFERGGDFNLQDWNLRVSSETICGIRCGFQPEAYCTRVAIIPPSGPPGRVIGRDPCPEDTGGVEGWWWVKRHERLDEHKGAGWVLGSQQPCWSRGLGRGRSASVTGCWRTGMRLATALLEPATPIHRQEEGPLRRPFVSLPLARTSGPGQVRTRVKLGNGSLADWPPAGAVA